MKTYTIQDREVAHNQLHIIDHDILQEFLLNDLEQSNEFDEEIKHFMFVHMNNSDRTFELTGDQEGEKIVINIFEPNGKLFETKSFYLEGASKCHISGKPVVFESNGDGTREYDVCCECEGHTHPDEMVTLPEEDDRMEVCSECHEKEKIVFDCETSEGVIVVEDSGSIEECEDKDNLVEAVIDQIKSDIAIEDVTAIDELLRFIPKKNLIGYLPEEDWKKYK